MEAGKPQKGLDFLRKAQPGERRERVADLQYNLGVAQEALGDQAQAAGHYLQAAQLYRSQGDGSSEGDTCLKLARCHIRMKVIHLTIALQYACRWAAALVLLIQIYDMFFSL